MFLLLKNTQQSSLFSAKMQKNSRQFLTTPTRSPYPFGTVAKSAVRCGSLFLSYKANNSTPNRAFFVRSIRTPQKSGFFRLFSMVGRNRHAYAWLLSLYEQFFHPVTLYRPNRGRFSGSSSKVIQGLSAMIYQFLGISRQHYDQTKAEQIRILADNETQARAFAARDYVLIPLGRLPDSAFNAQTLNAKGVRYA